MTDSSHIVEMAERLAKEAHLGQTDKAGEPYIGHVRRVAASVTPREPVYMAAAWLHDVVEDTGVTLDGLLAQGFPREVVVAVGLLTRRDEVPSETYYEQIAADPVALAVKIADIADNTNADRLARLDQETNTRLIAKYRNALRSLNRPELAAALGL
ncbi:HD domain-containing protein [Mycobacteroides salmoniphilum]|uniref:Bifunctional (P)ppGpp synthase/hydrolase RelA n=1 Tax=Mycobacteroides salmoniphilum TaxID=404941 RepID=A0A4R8SVE4_9MYCO|nr:HD domain-containing protein [Mycobacteroides salmoniphilum]TEA06292.1 Bifunctional (p)ppGpp synthase/hydrolase RelA [Mycobacteroides salmoniphilum]